MSDQRQWWIELLETIWSWLSWLVELIPIIGAILKAYDRRKDKERIKALEQQIKRQQALQQDPPENVTVQQQENQSHKKVINISGDATFYEDCNITIKNTRPPRRAYQKNSTGYESLIRINGQDNKVTLIRTTDQQYVSQDINGQDGNYILDVKAPVKVIVNGQYNRVIAKKINIDELVVTGMDITVKAQSYGIINNSGVDNTIR